MTARQRAGAVAWATAGLLAVALMGPAAWGQSASGPSAPAQSPRPLARPDGMMFQRNIPDPVRRAEALAVLTAMRAAGAGVSAGPVATPPVVAPVVAPDVAAVAPAPGATGPQTSAGGDGSTDTAAEAGAAPETEAPVPATPASPETDTAASEAGASTPVASGPAAPDVAQPDPAADLAADPAPLTAAATPPAEGSTEAAAGLGDGTQAESAAPAKDTAGADPAAAAEVAPISDPAPPVATTVQATDATAPGSDPPAAGTATPPVAKVAPATTTEEPDPLPAPVATAAVPLPAVGPAPATGSATPTDSAAPPDPAAPQTQAAATVPADPAEAVAPFVPDTAAERLAAPVSRAAAGVWAETQGADLRPRVRPDRGSAVAAAAPAPTMGQQLLAALRPEPRPRGLVVRRTPAPVAPAPEATPAAVIRPAPGASAPASRRGEVCGVPGLMGEVLAPIVGRANGCGVAQPVRITSVAGVKLSQGSIMDCPTARALNAWVQTGLQPAFRDQVAGLQVAGHYVCRTRNHKKGARLSEHSRGKAIDISGITLRNGTTLSILRDWRGRQGAPIKAAHKAACGIFGTTLGPGSDGMHEDHLHFDTASHRNGAYCR